MMAIVTRNNLKPGDIGIIVQLHGVLYAEECGLDYTFEAYVAGPLSEFALSPDKEKQRLWIVEMDGVVIGSLAIVRISSSEAQLRWFLLHPKARSKGFGKHLMEEAIEFSRNAGYERIILWTFNKLETAIALYKRYGFEKTDEKTHTIWGRLITEEKYELTLV